MVEAVNSQQSSVASLATARSHSQQSATQVFSMDSTVAASTDPATGQTSTSSSTGSQDNSGADDFRHLFGNPLPLAQAFSASNPPLPYGYPDPPTPVTTPVATAVITSGSAPASQPPAAAVPGSPFVPQFRPTTVTDGTNVWNANPDYFASRDTAQWIANKYGTGQLVTTPFEGSGGPFSASASEFQIVLPNGTMVNAGILASYYERNPEGQFPGVADSLIRSQLGLG